MKNGLRILPLEEEPGTDEISSSIDAGPPLALSDNMKGIDMAKYEEFNQGHLTLSSILTVNILLMVFTIPFAISFILSLHKDNSRFEWILWCGATFVMALLNVYSWKTFCCLKDEFCRLRELSAPSRRNLQRTHKFLFLSALIVMCFRLIVRATVVGECPDLVVHKFWSVWNCNPLASVRALPEAPSIVIMMIPIYYAVSVRGANFRFTFLLWFLAMASLVFSIAIAKAVTSLFFVALYGIGSMIILLEARRNNFLQFRIHKKLEDFLYHQEKAADEANAQEMRHMIANVAHDLKTPLSSFLSGLEYIAQVVGDIQEKKASNLQLSSADIEDIVHSISHCITNMSNTNSFMLMTINRCIDYTKASKGVKLVPKYETIDLQETLALPLNCMKDIQQRVSIVLEPLHRSICSHIITDKQWLQENVLCLLSNAVKYSNGGTVDLRISQVSNATSLALSGEIEDILLHDNAMENAIDPHVTKAMPVHSVRVEVEDHGIGLSEDAMATLFNPFKQAQRLAGGTGLGLFSLAKRIEALDGLCGVQRRRDGQEGSLFWFEIPYRPDLLASMASKRHFLSSSANIQLCGDDVNCASELRKSSSPKSLSAQSYPKGVSQMMTVLVVDDSPAILKMTSMMLKRHKHHVSTATNGAEAVKMVNERLEATGKGFDVVLMDLQMPVMDGLEATRRLRAMEMEPLGVEAGYRPWREQRKFVIIGVSANSDVETAAEAHRVGVDAFIPKPFSMEVFYRTVHSLGANVDAEDA